MLAQWIVTTAIIVLLISLITVIIRLAAART